MKQQPQQSHNYQLERSRMVQRQIEARGVTDPQVLEAMSRVPREEFIPNRLSEFAYEDSALPIDDGQTISQPFIVALMVEALALKQGARVLDVGTGSGYAAAVLGEIAAEVYSIERVALLAEQARQVLAKLGYRNVNVKVGDGTLGWPDAAPFDAILVSAGGPQTPHALRQQLAIGGRLVCPVGDSSQQQLICETRTSETDYETEILSRVRFVPLVGEQGWRDTTVPSADKTDKAQQHQDSDTQKAATGKKSLSRLIADAAQSFDDIETCELDSLLQRIGDARVVLIGEASHGSTEFYRMRARITRQLIERKGFNLVAVEADWPDAARIDHYVRDLGTPPSEWRAFTRFPTWMWRNTDLQEFVEWLRRHNAVLPERRRVAFYGLDLYSLFTSIDEVLRYLDRVDPQAAAVARERYGCLTPWQKDPATYGRAAASGKYRQCQSEVVDMLGALLDKRLEYSAGDGHYFLDAVQNARLVANAEEYYRGIYLGYADSWNLRDSHMFETLRSLLDHHGSDSKVVVWEHNSHIGDARATDMVVRGQHNLGQLCRQTFGNDTHLIGFGTHTGTVAAASNWGDDMQIMEVRPSLDDSWEGQCHESGVDAFILNVKAAEPRELRRQLRQSRHQRAIGVIYRPESEWVSHYFEARQGEQFDDYIWFAETGAVTPLDTETLAGMPETWPFGL